MDSPAAGRAVARGTRTIAAAVLLLVSSLAATVVSGMSGASPDDELARVEATLLPVVRESRYVVNARVRPFLFFWIGRDDIGDARVTWRANGLGRHAIELLVGSDPARAPRRINRWGYIREELGPEGANVLGVMKASNEETLEEAKARVESEKGGASTFKAVRTTIRGQRAVSGTITLDVPGNLTYRELGTLLAMIPEEPRVVKSTEFPEGAMSGFLVAMEAIIRASVEPCRARGAAKAVPAVAYLYNQRLYDLSLKACTYVAALRTAAATYAGVVEGRFQVRNRATTEVTSFTVAYGTAGELKEQPVRIEFRPRWWIEVELLLDGTVPARRQGDHSD